MLQQTFFSVWVWFVFSAYYNNVHSIRLQYIPAWQADQKDDTFVKTLHPFLCEVRPSCCSSEHTHV